ncbi:unnamed protein product [Rotaria sp. Silwood1]|nr:unnamed protein product [Rotaria sp. Silwood1]CAF0743532.1 unnamed protein product [Rotaria sp. Silwood1]CAF0799359.1 unnamed protein product [Rotaria sp. Silwood1]CAF3334498.1 unnamed protein product [Rotaria sp. Silwood1]CAF3350820.1 unnamed protein product [Rotaria sp. Silwood1]
MNNSIDYGNETDSFTRYFNIYVNLFFVTFGNVGNLLKVGFFLQKPLRSCTCSVFILVATFSNFATLNNLPLHRFLTNVYLSSNWIDAGVGWSKIEKTGSNPSYDTVSKFDIIVCKLRIYFHMLSASLTFQMLLLASINRLSWSWRRKKHQQQSCFRRVADYFYHLSNAFKLCLVSCIVWAIISLQHVFNYTIVSRSQGCVARNLILWTIWVTTIHCLVLPVLMILFGILTLKNLRTLPTIRCLHNRRYDQNRKFVQMCHHCVHSRQSTQYQIEKQLTLMIIAEIIVTVLTSFPYAAYSFYRLLTINKQSRAVGFIFI